MILMKPLTGIICSAAALLVCSCSAPEPSTSYTDYVDTYIGTGGHGHVFMGANVPFGLVQLGPTSIPQSWDWVSGYHISDTTVIGFSHLHLSGTGIGDLSDVLMMPTIGNTTHARGTADDPESGHWSYFSRENEETRPGYYATRLDRHGIDVELTATQRVGFHKYTFPESEDARIIFDLENGTCWDAPVESYIAKIDDKSIQGYRYSKGWANNQKIYFYAEFSKPMTEFAAFDGDLFVNGSEFKGVKTYGEAIFNTTDGEPIYVKVALSPVSMENAKLNMAEELPGWDFEATIDNADNAWNEELSKIRIETKTDSVKRIFYTALYHSMIAPSVFSDVNGEYRGSDGNNYPSDGFTNYTTFSLWDTYRAAHPLMSIIHPEKMSDMVNTMLHIYKQQGKLPVWHLMGCETDCMVGNPGISVVADAMLKGYGGYDPEEAYTALKESAMLDERGMDLRKKYGFIPYDQHNESVAICMEYAIADWAVAQVAKKMGKEEDYNYFMERSKSYKHYFDPKTGFVRGRNVEGKFREPFSPFASTHREDDYTEGNAWQYTFLVPHDVEGLAELFGGKEQFVTKLDSLFIVQGDLGAEASPDISGLIGQYAHGNEPSHHVIYFYTMIDQPWKAADRVREVLSTMYHDRPDGLSGNEDVGQMSSWYILSALGMYQVEPVGGRYFFGSPIIDRAMVKVSDDRTLDIIVKNNSDVNKYIQKIELNGKKYQKNYITFEDLSSGGRLEITMGAEPTLWY